ncbi:MAG: SDR family oxidoreductase [Cyanobacteria bacterium J06606_4]
MPKYDIDWSEKTAVITGGGSGIGRATAIALSQKGTTVHAVDLHPARLAALIDELPDNTTNVYVHTVDVTSPEQLGQLASDIQGNVDILINCAGILHQGKLATTPNKDLHQVLDVNLWGAIYSIKAFLPKLRACQAKIHQTESDQKRKHHQGSHIINIASIAGLLSSPEMALYNTSKAALLGLTESLSIELVADNIQVSAVCPGAIKTNLGRDGRFSSDSTVSRVVNNSIRNGASPDLVAQDIIQVIERSSLFKLSRVEWFWQVLWFCKRLFPALYPKLASVVYHRVIAKGLANCLLMPTPKTKQWL